MNTNTIIWVLVAIVVIGGGYFLLGSSEKSDNMEATMEDKTAALPHDGDDMMDEKDDMEMADDMSDDAMMEDDTMQEKGGDDMMPSGTYAPYSEEKLAMASEGKTVLFFKASWCPSCRSLDKDIQENVMDIPEGVTILEVNYDTATDLKKKYGVTSQHTLVQVDAAGNEVAQWAGSPSLASVLKKIQ